MGRAPACDLHGILDLHAKLGVATHVQPDLEDVMFLKQNQLLNVQYRRNWN